MAIMGTLTGVGISATFNSANGVSDVVVKKRKGAIFLEAQAPGFPDWLLVSNETGAFSVSTPDPAVNYRFRGGANCDADYYMGP